MPRRSHIHCNAVRLRAGYGEQLGENNTRVVIGGSGAHPLRLAGRLLLDTSHNLWPGRWMTKRAGVEKSAPVMARERQSTS